MPISKDPPGNATASIREIWRRVARNWGNTAIVSWGVYHCRPIAGTNIPSQHAWANAWDVAGPSTVLDAIAGFCRGESMRGLVAEVFWRVPAHYDHVHITGRPKRTGVPPCMGGPEQVLRTPGIPAPIRRQRVAEVVAAESWSRIMVPTARSLERETERIAGTIRRLDRAMRR